MLLPTCSWALVACGAEANRFASYDDIVARRTDHKGEVRVGEKNPVQWDKYSLKDAARQFREPLIRIQAHKCRFERSIIPFQPRRQYQIHDKRKQDESK